ncbi:hypothetical protein KAW50_03655 [candidate division WOR-3 bacterium]|nr:hypothetical protein [candidate division WOR-3 bacterium]
MLYSDLKGKKIKPLGKRVALLWVPSKRRSGIIIPESVYKLRLKEGRFYLGQIIALGPEVQGLKPKEYVLFPEYGVKNFKGEFKEDEIYFIDLEEIICKAEEITDIDPNYRPPMTKGEEDQLEKQTGISIHTGDPKEDKTLWDQVKKGK